jgi:hypothetical protein
MKKDEKVYYYVFEYGVTYIDYVDTHPMMKTMMNWNLR